MTEQALKALQENSGKILGFGVGLVLIGLLAIGNAATTTVLFTVMVGFCALAAGVLQGLHCLRSRVWGVQIVSAIVLTAFGLLVLTKVTEGVVTLTALLALFFVVQGAQKISFALKLKPMRNWNYLLYSGIAALLLGLLLLFKMPEWALGLMIGIDLVFGGWSLVLVAMAVRASKPT